MDTGKEIKSAIKNIRYYTSEIDRLAKLQMDKDCDIGKAFGINNEPGGTRFRALGTIMSSAEWIEVYCKNIESNVKYAEEQDSLLRSSEPPDIDEDVPF